MCVCIEFADNRSPVRVSKMQLHNAYIYIYLYKVECVITAVFKLYLGSSTRKAFSLLSPPPSPPPLLFYYRKKVSLIYESFYETVFLF